MKFELAGRSADQLSVVNVTTRHIVTLIVTSNSCHCVTLAVRAGISTNDLKN